MMLPLYGSKSIPGQLRLERRGATRLLVSALVLILLGQSSSFAVSEGSVSATVTTTPLALSVSAPKKVRVGRRFGVKATVVNRGESEITQAAAAIHLPDGLTLISSEAEQDIGVIPPRRKKAVRWVVKASEVGTYVITITVSGQYEGSAVEAEAARTVEVKKRLSLWERLLGMLGSVSAR